MAIIKGTDNNDTLSGASGDITERVSTTSLGDEANGFSSFPSFSSDGTKFVFSSNADNLVANDTNGAFDVFVKDLGTGAVTRISTDSSGGQSNGSSFEAVFSPDGTKIAFASFANNLVSPTATSFRSIFVKDLTTGATTLVSADSAGNPSNDYSNHPVFSPDGTKVAFSSNANNLVPNDTVGDDIFIKDLATGAITRVSTNSAGDQQTGVSSDVFGAVLPDFSPDGTKIAFVTVGNNLVTGDNNGAYDLFIKNLSTGAVTCASTDSAGAFGNGDVSISSVPVFSPDSTKILFVSGSSNLVTGDNNNVDDVFIKDLVTGGVTRISTDAAGVEANGGSSTPVLSPDGTKVAFSSHANNLVPGDANGTDDIFIKDLVTGAVTLVSKSTDGLHGNGDSVLPGFSSDGTHLLFASDGDNLVPNDSNAGSGGTDVFLVTQGAGEADTISGGKGNDALSGEAGADTVYGNTGNDRLYGGSDDDTLFGQDGSDTLHGDQGNDSMDGGKGQDTLFGDDGNDTLHGNGNNDWISGGDGDDNVLGDGGDDHIEGGAGKDNLHGGSGNDFLHGGGSSDRLYGDSGNDELHGGSGTNWITGGTGADKFFIDIQNFDGTPDKVTDFKLAEGDTLHISPILEHFDPLTSAITDFVKATQVGSDTVISIDRDGPAALFTSYFDVMTLRGVTGIDIQDMYNNGQLVVHTV